MQRSLRYILNAATALSLFLCLATLALNWRATRMARNDFFYFTTPWRTLVQFESTGYDSRYKSDPCGFGFYTHQGFPSAEGPCWRTHEIGSPFHGWLPSGTSTSFEVRRRMGVWACYGRMRLAIDENGRAWQQWTDENHSNRTAGDTALSPMFHIIVPHWMAACLFALPPIARAAIFAIRRRRRAKRHRANLCPTCGYDTRATPTRCPECGTTLSDRPRT